MNQHFKKFLLFFLFANLSLFGQTPVADSINSITDKTRIIKYRKLQIGIVGAIGILQLPKAPAARNIEYFEKFGSATGIHLQYNLKRNAALTLNCLYEQKNWNSSNINYSGNYQKSDNTFHELTFPLLFKYSPFYRNFFVSAGPYLGIILKKEVKGLEEGNYVYQNPFEAGAALGIGFNIPISNRISLILEGRDYINIKTSKALSDYTKMNTATLQLGAFYKFGKTEQIKIKTRTRDSIIGKKVFVKFFYSPQMTYRIKHTERTRFVEFYSDYPQTLSYDTDAEIPTYGDEFGLLFEFKLSTKFNLNTGMTLDNQGFTTKPTDINHHAPSSMYPGTYYSDTESNKTVTYKIHFISLPLILNYEFKHKSKKYIYIGAGFESKLRYSYKINGGHIGNDNSGFDIFGNYFYIVNVGANIPLAKKLSLFLEPYYKSQVGGTVFNNNSLSLRLWSAGCRVGIKF